MTYALRWADAFTRADGTPDPAPDGNPYTVNGSWAIAGNQVASTGGAADALVFDTGVVNGAVECLIIGDPGVNNCGVVMRYLDAATWMRCVADDSTVYLDDGTTTFAFLAASPVGKVLRCEFTGHHYDVYLDGVFLFAYDDLGDFNLFGTVHGLHANNTTAALDNLTVDELTSVEMIEEVDEVFPLEPGPLARIDELDEIFGISAAVPLALIEEIEQIFRLMPAAVPGAPEWALAITEDDGTPVYTFAHGAAAAESPVLDAQGSDPRRDIGSGGIALPAGSALNAHMTEDRLAHLYVRGHLVTSYEITVPNDQLIGRSGRTSDISTYGLLTLNAVLAQGMIEPPRGPDIQPFGDDIIFDSSHPAFVPDARFVPAHVLGSVTDATANYRIPPYGVGFAAPDLVQVCGPPGYGYNDNAPSGDYFALIDHPFVGTGGRRFRACFDNGGEARLDNVTLIPFTGGWAATSSRDVFISEGTRRIWVKVENGGIGGGHDGPATFAIEIVKLDAAGNEILPPEFVSDSSMLITAVPPPEPPGWTIGKIALYAVNQMQLLSKLLGVTFSFTDLVDSNGVPWRNTWDVSTKAGTNTLATFFLKELADTYADFRVTWNGTNRVLNCYQKDTYGQTVAVPLTEANIGDLGVTRGRREATEFGVTHTIGGTRGYHRAVGPVDAGHPRKLLPLSLGSVRSLAELDRVAGAQTAQFRSQRANEKITHLTTQSTPDSQMPGLAYWTSDTLPIPVDASFDTSNTRIEDMLWRLSRQTGQFEFTPELGESILTPAERDKQSIRKLLGGDVGGQSRVVSPPSPVFAGRDRPGGGG